MALPHLTLTFACHCTELAGTLTQTLSHTLAHTGSHVDAAAALRRMMAAEKGRVLNQRRERHQVLEQNRKKMVIALIASPHTSLHRAINGFHSDMCVTPGGAKRENRQAVQQATVDC